MRLNAGKSLLGFLLPPEKVKQVTGAFACSLRARELGLEMGGGHRQDQVQGSGWRADWWFAHPLVALCASSVIDQPALYLGSWVFPAAFRDP